jgi:DNA-binding CsgD family transcriptional regulator
MIGLDALSRREREVALLASRGETAAEIARRLVISERTVETHLAGVYAKLGVRSKSELIRRADEFGI